jgi:hypothetical protein
MESKNDVIIIARRSERVKILLFLAEKYGIVLASHFHILTIDGRLMHCSV